MNPFIKTYRNYDYSLSMVITGGGTEIIPNLLKYGGMSQKVHEIYIPYSQDALERYIGKPIEKYVSEDVAEKMARKCFADSPSPYAIGVGVTASLCRHENERDGRENLAYICIVGGSGLIAPFIYNYKVELSKIYEYNQDLSQENRIHQEEKLAYQINMFISDIIEKHFSINN